jgi:DNA-binding NarL/FixJ family response regulator
VVGEASDGAEAITQAQALHPDVILMDLVMPRLDGIEATRHITLNQPGVRVLVLTSFAADDKVFPAIKAGALGYLLKDTGRMTWCRRSIKFIKGWLRWSLPLPAKCSASWLIRPKSL